MAKYPPVGKVATLEETNSENFSEISRIQDSLPFDNKTNINSKKFILPDLKLLGSPSKNEKTAKYLM